MFKSKNKKMQARSPARQARTGDSSSFRRNNVVVSRSQREQREHQQSVTQRQYDRKKQLQRRSLRNRAIVCTVAAVLISLLVRMRVSSVVVQPQDSVTISAELSRQYANTISNAVKKHAVLGQFWAADTEAITREVTKTHPEVSGITYSSGVPFTTQLSANIRFRTPLFVWKDATGSQQFVDNSGVLFTNNPNKAINTTKLIHIEDQSGVVLEQGSSVLTGEFIEFVGQLPRALSRTFPDKKMALSQVIIPRSTREVQFKMGELPYLVRFSSSQPLDIQVQELETLLTSLSQQGIAPSAYIDLRVPGKAFYK